MFGANKPAFGSNTSGFGSFNTGATAASPFSGFKPATAGSAFGAPPAFGAATAQPATGGLFGATNTSAGLFGTSTATAAPTFGNTSTGFGGFGAGTSSGGLFSNNASTGLFGNAQNTSAFGAKPAGFGFASTATTGTSGGGLFGAPPAAAGGLFGQQGSALGAPTGGLFATNTGGFGQQQQQAGTGHVKYNPVVGTDVVVKSGASQSVNIKHHCITCMKEYENKSLEELRLEDYTAGRKGGGGGGGGGGVFGFQQPENKSLFGGSTFGQPATTTASNVFGGGALGTSAGFGQASTFSFGSNTQTNANTSGGLFGAAKPAFGAAPATGTGLFGATTTQAPSFGTTTASFGFGSNTQNQQQGGGVFGAKPATTGFGATPASTAFGGFGAPGGGGLFGKPTQAQAPTLPPAFGSLNTGSFGTNTATTGGSLFGNNTFGKPNTTAPAFGFSAPNTQLGGGLGGGLGANTFQAKPAAPAFGALGGGSLFQTPQSNAFNAGKDSGLGGSMFGNNTLGAGLGLGMGTPQAANANLSGSSAAGNVHEQILTLVARPYGDSPLFKDLPTDAPASTEVLKPTNPACVKAVLDGANCHKYRVAPAQRLKLQPHAALDKKSLFDGLEESDASLEEKLSLKPSRKRLVLRPKANDSVDGPEGNLRNRSLEEQPLNSSANGPELGRPAEAEARKSNGEDGRFGKNISDNRNLYTSADRHGSWLNASKHNWSADKEKSIDNEPTPRLYPNLDKEGPLQGPERRASWLTTAPLRKPPPPPCDPEAAESSVRALAVRPHPTPAGAGGATPRARDLDRSDLSDEENVAPRESPPHPAGVKLTRPGYYTIPSLDEMTKYLRADGACVVPSLTVGRKNYGNVYYDCEIDVAGLDLDAIVHFMNKEVTVYPDDEDKPPVGAGLNRRAVVTLDRIWPRDKTERRPITDPQRLMTMGYEDKLRRVCDKHDTKFIEYRPQTGSWVFRVEHFSKYSLTESDEEEEMTPDVLKRQLVNQALQKAAPVAPPKSPAQAPAAGQGGLGGLGGPLYPPGPPLGAPGALPAPDMSASLTSLPPPFGIRSDTTKAPAFDMDTTEDNTESQSLYADSHRAFGVKSPTGELARLEHRHSHSVQLMKASLYDTEMDDAASVSTGDQLVPRAPGPPPPPPAHPRPPSVHTDSTADDPTPLTTEEIPMKPLIVRPHTIVLKYHRKVPPFNKTFAGRLHAACIADMAVCRARHARAGFGPGNVLAYTATYDAVADLPHSADLFELGKYVRGRAADDWSEPVVVRLALARPDDKLFLDKMKHHLEVLLEHSSFSEAPGGAGGAGGAEACPRLSLRPEPAVRRAALRGLAEYYAGTRKDHPQFGVSNSYCKEVFELCEALWGADLDNDGEAGTDEASIVNRHRQFLAWLSSVTAAATDDELKRPVQPEPEDESDAHSVRVWSLLLGGRVAEACKVAVEHGDCNMAALLAQSAGDLSFRSLVSRQVSQWRACGADALVAGPRLAALHLAAGLPPRRALADAAWLHALHATARFLCPQVPTLEQVTRTYEALFEEGADGEAVELSLLEPDEMGMRLPLPPYLEDYDVTRSDGDRQRKVLDLRYELIKARALNQRPRLRPAAYTPDPMDYSLCFLLSVWFGVPSRSIVTGASEQLEACGAWHLALQALLYHPDDAVRSHLIRNMLSRHAPTKGDSPEAAAQLELVKRLRLPDSWLLLATAHRAKYEHLPTLEAECLAGAGQWNAAHRVLLDELLPEAVLSDDLQSIAPLLEKLNEAATRHEVSGWEAGGQALHHYIHVTREIRALVCGAERAPERAEVAARLEALRPRVAAACRALGRLEAPTARHLAARAEMGARLLQLAVGAGEPAPHLAALLRALRLPPGAAPPALRQITTELAERAAELCIESVGASPMSSRH